MDFILSINCIDTLLKELYTIFGNLIIVFLLWSSVHPLLSVRSSSPLWTALKLCWESPLAMKIYVNWCLLYVMAHTTQRISSRPIADKWLVSGNGGCHLNGHKNTILGQIVDITDNLLLEELWTVDYCIFVLC